MLKTEDDVWLFSLIVSLSSLFGGITSVWMIRYQDGLVMHWVSLDKIKQAYKESIPFFLSNVTGVVKEQGIVVLIGSFLGMKDVAIYDLAYKIIIIPRTLFSKLNDAFYPKLLVNRKRSSIVQILKVEFLIGLLIILGVALFGRFAVSILGGEEMLDAYYVCIILSVTVMGWLLAGAYIQFCFIPEGYSSMILHNQIVALVSCFLVSGIGLYVLHNVYGLVVGIACSSICEIIFCSYIVRKYKLL
jgi:PST family polysaccharide transporter